MVKRCSSCGVEVVEEYTEFLCPQCGKEKIIRCKRCRELIRPYTCPACGFQGP